MKTPSINCLEIEGLSLSPSNSFCLNKASGKSHLPLEYSARLSTMGLDPRLLVTPVA